MQFWSEIRIFARIKEYFSQFRRSPQHILYAKKQSFWSRYKVKIASTLFAILIWFLIVTGDTFDYIVDVPIIASRTRDMFIVTSRLPEKAKIHLRGQGMALLGFLLFREGKLQLEFDWREGEQTIRPAKKGILLTGGAKNLVIEELLEPTEIKVTIEKLKKKKVPIHNNVTLKPAAGYTIVGSIKLQPNQAEIIGPHSSTDSCKVAETQKDLWDKLKRPVARQVPLVKPPYHLVRLLQQKTTIIADIQKLMEKRLEQVPVSVKHLPPNIKAIVIPSHLSLTLIGGVSVVAGVTEKDIIAYIDYGKYRNQNAKDFPAYIEPIPNIRFTNIEPQRFKIVLERE